MAETLGEQLTAEQRVFGDAFTLDNGAADQTACARYAEERLRMIIDRQTTWFARILDADGGVSADLVRDRKRVARLNVDYDQFDMERRLQLAEVHTNAGGTFGDTVLCEGVPFEEAVAAAEEYVANF